MTYYLDLFSPETYEAYRRSDRLVSGFRERHWSIATRVKPGDKLICYITKFSRWGGILEVAEGPFRDSTPIFYPEDDPFIVRFKVRPLILLDPEEALPIHDRAIWDHLTFTKNSKPNTGQWTGKLRGSLVQLEEADGQLLERLLKKQSQEHKAFPIDEETKRKLGTHTVRRTDKTITVTVPDDHIEDSEPEKSSKTDVRESIKFQALLAEIGSRMGLKIWIPKSDRGLVLNEWKDEKGALIEKLPLNYDDTTLKTIENIDVLWLNGRSIVRAFEVEHTTSIYSGILRMADLLALQPNMDIKLHIVAPAEKRERVFQEIRRPVFSLLERDPLSEMCTFLSYDSLRELSQQKHIEHLSDTVLDEYAEVAE